MTYGYWLFLLMIIPVIAGIIAWVKFKTIDFREAGVSVGSALLLLALALALSKCSDNFDTETHSGRVLEVVHIPEWEAEWTELEIYTTTDSEGNDEFHTRLVTRHETHWPKWYAETTLGKISISENFFNLVGKKHGIEKVTGYRPNYDSGDKYDYYSYVKDDPEYCDYPITQLRAWSNPLKFTKSLHSYKDISDEEASKLKLPPYPKNNMFNSSRLIGGNDIKIWNWDKMNTAIGERDHVNLILVRLDGGVEKAKNLQAYWKNGKKNDIVICYGGNRGQPAEWCYVFGWSKTELVKLNLQTLFIEKPVNDSIIPDIKKIIRKDFEPHDWTIYEDNDFLIPTGWVITAFILMLIIQGILYYNFHINNKTFG